MTKILIAAFIGSGLGIILSHLIIDWYHSVKAKKYAEKLTKDLKELQEKILELDNEDNN